MPFTELTQAFCSEEKTLQYLNEMEFFEQKTCWKCKRSMTIDFNRRSYRCNKRTCKKEISIFKHTFFENTKMPLNSLIWIAYMYLHKMPISGIISTSGIHSEAVSEWTKFIRQMVADCVESEQVKIGGPNIIIEVDETKLGKRKYHRGHKVEGVWIIAGVERTNEKKLFLIEVEDRSASTILEVFRTFVLPGSVVYTDGWAAYPQVCNELNLEHHYVNHKHFFKDPNTGVHTNTVEGTNNGIKHLIKPRNRTKKNINDHLYYYIWRRQNKNNIWLAFINALKEVVYK